MCAASMYVMDLNSQTQNQRVESGQPGDGGRGKEKDGQSVQSLDYTR
jgi:hypothetical protein